MVPTADLEQALVGRYVMPGVQSMLIACPDAASVWIGAGVGA
jgi:hypothetical protein